MNRLRSLDLEDLLDQLELLGYRAVAICRKTGLQRPDECWATSHQMLSGGGFSEERRGEGPTRYAAVADLLARVARDV